MASFKLPVVIIMFFLIQAGFWIAIARWYRRRIESMRARLLEGVAQAGAALIAPPRMALYRGAKFGYPRRRGSGLVCVTEGDIIFQRLFGGEFRIPLADVATVLEATGGRSALPHGDHHLVIRTFGKNQIVFLLKDPSPLRNTIVSRTARGKAKGLVTALVAASVLYIPIAVC